MYWDLATQYKLSRVRVSIDEILPVVDVDHFFHAAAVRFESVRTIKISLF